jgi:hypothetical protein
LARAGDETHLTADGGVETDSFEMTLDHVAILTDVIKKSRLF